MKFCSSTQTDYPFIANGVLIVGNAQRRCTSGALSWIGKEVDSSDIIHEILQDLIYYQKSGGGITSQGVNLCSKKILR